MTKLLLIFSLFFNITENPTKTENVEIYKIEDATSCKSLEDFMNSVFTPRVSGWHCEVEKDFEWCWGCWYSPIDGTPTCQKCYHWNGSNEVICYRYKADGTIVE
mgnify:CR=1 FL=1